MADLSQPTKPSASVDGTTATVTWTKVTDADSYTVTPSGGITPQALGDVDTAVFSGLDHFTEYTFTVIAQDSTVTFTDSPESDPSDAVLTRTPGVAQRTAPSDEPLTTDAGDGFTAALARVGNQVTRTEATENGVTHGTLIMSDERSDSGSDAVEPTFSDRVGPEMGVTTTIVGNPPAPL